MDIVEKSTARSVQPSPPKRHPATYATTGRVPLANQISLRGARMRLVPHELDPLWGRFPQGHHLENVVVMLMELYSSHRQQQVQNEHA